MSSFDIAHRLTMYGFKKELIDFDEILAQAWWGYYEEHYKTVEEMLCNCCAALTFCQEVREAAGIPLRDTEILLRLINVRKSGFLKTWREK